MFDFLSKKFSAIFSDLTGKSKITNENVVEVLEKVKDSLIDADVSYELVNKFIDQIKSDILGKKVIESLNPSEHFIKVVYDRMLDFLGGEYLQKSFIFQIPSIILVMGLQGAGKTSTIAKLAYFIKKNAESRGKIRKILCASVDFYRPAAIDQLEILANRVGVDFYRSAKNNSIDAAKDILDFYKKNNYENLLFDTAGRLHVNESMMDEIKKINDLLLPKYKFLVLDAMTGQESLAVAKNFLEKIGFDAAILAKMDSETKGGAAFAFRFELKKPILFVGTGEKLENLELFRPERIAKRMLGMGDIISLVEAADEKIKKNEQDEIERSLSKNNMNLEDFLKQMEMLSKLGSFSSFLKYLPGINMPTISSDMVERGESDIKKFKALINSMTKKERINYKSLDASRKARIAKGAGYNAEDVNYLIRKFEESKKFVKIVNNNKFFR